MADKSKDSVYPENQKENEENSEDNVMKSITPMMLVYAGPEFFGKNKECKNEVKKKRKC